MKRMKVTIIKDPNDFYSLKERIISNKKWVEFILSLSGDDENIQNDLYKFIRKQCEGTADCEDCPVFFYTACAYHTSLDIANVIRTEAVLNII